MSQPDVKFYDTEGNEISEENVHWFAMVLQANCDVTHANGRLCDDDCEANGHYRTFNDATGEYEYEEK